MTGRNRKMIKNALKTIAPFVVGISAGVLLAVLIFGDQTASRTVVAVIIGILAAFAAALLSAKKKSNNKNK